MEDISDITQEKTPESLYSFNNITTTLIQISRLFYFGFFSKTNHQFLDQKASVICKAQKVQKYALNSQLSTGTSNFDKW